MHDRARLIPAKVRHPPRHQAQASGSEGYCCYPAESVPFLGVAVLIADAVYELYAACETTRKLGQLYSDMGVADETSDDVMHNVCHPTLPDARDT